MDIFPSSLEASLPPSHFLSSPLPYTPNLSAFLLIPWLPCPSSLLLPLNYPDYIIISGDQSLSSVLARLSPRVGNLRSSRTQTLSLLSALSLFSSSFLQYFPLSFLNHSFKKSLIAGVPPLYARISLRCTNSARHSVHGFLLFGDPLMSYCPNTSEERCPYIYQSRYEVKLHLILLELSGKFCWMVVISP